MKYLNYITLFVVGLLLTGCYKDLGNYDYNEINEVKFSGFPTEKVFAFRNVDSIKVYPDIEGTLQAKDLSHYSFKWEAVVKSGSADGKTNFPLDSNTVNLEYFVKLPDAEYSVYLYVKDETTNVTWRQAFDLKVTTSLNEGWMILSEDQGFCRLDVVSLSGKDELLVRDIWAGTPLATRKGPRQIGHWADMYEAGSGNHPVYLVADDGGVKLDNEDFSYDPVNELQYEFGLYPEGFIPWCMAGDYMDSWRICVCNKGVYAKNEMTSGAIYGMPINKIEGEKDYYGVAPAIGMSPYPYNMGPAIVLYDTTNRRFVQVASNLRGTRLPTTPETVFPFKTGKKFVYMTSTLHDTYGYVFTILKDDAAKLWLYGLKMGYSSTMTQADKYYYQLDAPDIDKATCFAVHPILYYLFYAVGNQIHQFDMVTKEHRILPMVFEDGEKNNLPENKITLLKFNPFILGTYGKPADIALLQNYLIIGSEKEGTALGGVVRMLEIPTAMDKSATVKKAYDGFGKVVDVVYRERK
ncbi:MAG: PKD-like family lipoprotein [Odoribacter splanchnicus]